MSSLSLSRKHAAVQITESADLDYPNPRAYYVYMESKWSELKDRAMLLRGRGYSIPRLKKELGIPKSTLSGWLKGVEISPEGKRLLSSHWHKKLAEARRKAVQWHNGQKAERLRIAEKEAHDVLTAINPKDPAILDLTLAILYLGEGSKRNCETGLGSSDPPTVKFFVNCLRKIYRINNSQLRCELYLRADQDPNKMKRFWAEELQLPLSNFRQVNIDKRTIGKPTYPGYFGVCNVRCGNVAIQRKLVFLAKKFMARITKGS